MKRGIFLLLLISNIILIFSLDNSAAYGITGNSIITPPPTPSCSNQSIQEVWGVLFKRPFTNITVYRRTISTTNCMFVAYNVLPNNNLTLLVGVEYQIPLVGYKRKIRAANTRVSSQYLINLKENSILENFYNILISDGSLIGEDNLIYRQQSISTKIQADSKFKESFKVFPNTWTKYDDYTGTYYMSSETNQSTFGLKTADYSVDGNYSIEEYKYSQNFQEQGNLSKNPDPLCVANWSIHQTTCSTQERLTVYYSDINNCNNNTGRPSNFTKVCDYDNDGFIGNSSSVNQTNFNYTFKTISNISENNQTVFIEISENNQTGVWFYHNKSEKPLDIGNITIIKNNQSDSRSYVIINGIEENKTIILKKLNPFSNSVCVIDGFVRSISEFTRNCTSSREQMISCNGQGDDIICNIVDNDLFIIDGLIHSAVMEFVPIASDCTPNWVCSNWSDCSGNIHTRTCSDISNCNNTDREETGECDMTNDDDSNLTQPRCIPNWSNCSDWSPAKCKSGSNQTRTCIDINNCSSATNKKLESHICQVKNTSKTKTILKILIILLSTTLILLGSIVLILFILKKSNTKKDEVLVIPPSDKVNQQQGL